MSALLWSWLGWMQLLPAGGVGLDSVPPKKKRGEQDMIDIMYSIVHGETQMIMISDIQK